MALPRGIRNNNPLNIRKGNNWKGERQPQTDPAFEEFKSMEYGIRAGFKILRNYMTGYHGMVAKRNTVQSIIERWAPPIENATNNYATFVADKMGISRYQKFDFSDRKKMVDLVDAMIQVECGQKIDRAIIESAYDMV